MSLPDVTFTPATASTRIRHPHLKACRAKEHLDALDKAIQGFVESKPYRIDLKDDLQAGECVLCVELVGPIPFDLALIAADFISCLRSSLDYLAYQLACVGLAPEQPSTSIMFPIFGENTAEIAGKLKRFTKGMPPPAISQIESLQPYYHGKRYQLTLLWRLHVLAGIVKHRHVGIHSHGIFVNFPGLNLGPGDIKTTDLNDRYELRFPIALKPKMELKPRVFVEIEFGDLAEGIRVTTDDFRNMYEFVAHKIIPSFASFLS
jgi:hypothetical protein